MLTHFICVHSVFDETKKKKMLCFVNLLGNKFMQCGLK